jgi:acetyl esterase/lipase
LKLSLWIESSGNLSNVTQIALANTLNSIQTSLLLLTAILMQPVSAQMEFPIWGEESPPYSKENGLEEYVAPCWGADCAYKVVTPTLTIYTPKKATNSNAVLVLPGGGYDVVAIFHEGSEIAKKLAENGTTAAVLKYRLPNPETSTDPELVPLSDVRQAMRLLRDRQKDFHFQAERIGVMGFSAGGHLATFASLHRVADPDLNPDFSMLIYGVTRLSPTNQQWLEESLYHRKLTDVEVAEQTLLNHVDENSPPAFIVHAMDDETCHFTESTFYADALTRNGVDVEMHLFPHGGHCFGPARKDDGTDQWLLLAANWLNRQR